VASFARGAVLLARPRPWRGVPTQVRPEHESAPVLRRRLAAMPETGGAVDFRILGPLEVVAGGTALDIGAPKLRVVLAALLLEPNRVVSSDRLIEALWEESPPETAPKALQVYVSQLRKLLGAERVRRSGQGYVLQVAPDELDLSRFERLRDEGRLEDALALWRGPPLADFAYDRFAAAEIERLKEVRLACLEERIRRDLEHGRHAELVSELELLTSEYPLREGLRAQLMLALYRAGRQAEALETYQDARRELVESLGIEPGRPLRELEKAILVQDPALDPAATPEGVGAAEASRGVFVGRNAELAALLYGLDEALAGGGRLFLIAGEPGIGKSRLVEELAAHARRRGALVLVGRCWEAGGAPAYWPWVQALRSYIAELEPEALRARLGVGSVELAQLFPELQTLVPAATPDPSGPEGARFRLFDSMSAFLRSAASVQPLVLVLDDLHAADEPSLLLLRFVARELDGMRILVAAAYRDVDPLLTDPLTTALAELGRERVTRTLGLVGLAESDVASFIELTTARAPAPGLATSVYAETDGNPLFVGEIVRLLAAEGRLDEASVDRFSVPESVRGVIRRRLGRLSEECRQLLTLASVLGREFDLDVLAKMAALERTALLGLLDEAMAARVVSEAPGSIGRLRFAHALIRDTVYEDLTRARRVQLHGQAGAALEALHAADLDPQLAELAHHFFQAAPAGDVQRAVDYGRLAGERAVRLLAYEEAVRLYRMALGLSEAGDAARCELLLALGDAQTRAGDEPGWKETFQEAAELADSLGLPEQLARAALGYGGRIIWDVSRDSGNLIAILERALDVLPEEDSILRARLMARLAGGPLRDSSFPRERRRALSQEALEMARRIGDASTLAYALAAYGFSRHSPDFTREQLAIGGEQLEYALQAGDHERALEAHEHRLVALIELGEIAEAKVELEAMASLAAGLRQPSHDWFVTVYRAQMALLEGEFADAERLIFEARAFGERAQSWSAAVSYVLQLYLLRSDQGRLEELEELVRQAAIDHPTYPILRCVDVHVAARLRRDDAGPRFEALATDRFGSLAFDEEWLVGMSFLAEAAAILEHEAGAAVLYELLLPYADHVAISYPEISTGAVARYLGLLASTTSRWDDAIRHLEDAVRLNERIGARSWLAHTRHELARALVAGKGERERPAQLLSAALATFRELAMEDSAADAAALSDELGAG
jgi:DNA-binding SARP family transcriptional activator/tetratricopeptide (TPR) repeat protein